MEIFRFKMEISHLKMENFRFTPFSYRCLPAIFQTMIAQINHVIGAEGVVSLECKKVVSKYGDIIWELLISGVAFFLLFFF